ncbi:MAG: hypothetical protein FJX75_06500 [Armatimonadetes bacterium]|nr:hypothetical protein [Armatimonadota bacterium]
MLFALLSLPVLAHGSEPRPVALYNVQRCTQPPVVDGDLQADACWQALPLADHFYQYWKPVPTRPPLRTSFRACFDDAGLYLGITLEDEHMATLKADIKDRDNPETWTDDCVEIMVDPFNTGDSYTKFTVNANGVRHDQVASHLELNDGWSSESWRAGVRKYAEEWTIEVSLPWSDLGAKPRDGDVWSFDLVRYSFSTGAFRGVTWSLGGAGAAPRNFGYLGFGRFDLGRKADCDRLARAAEKTKGRSLQVHQSGGVYVRDEQGNWTRHDTHEWPLAPAQQAREALDEARAALADLPEDEARATLEAERAALRERLREVESSASEIASVSTGFWRRQDAVVILREATELKWRCLLLNLVASGP